MKIGTVKTNRRPRITLKNWVKDNWKEGKQVELKIIRIFLPNRFPNFTLVMLDNDNNVEITRTLHEEKGKELLKAFDFSVKKETEGTLYLIIRPNGDIEIERISEKDKIYIFNNNSFVLINKKEKEKSKRIVDDDLPF